MESTGLKSQHRDDFMCNTTDIQKGVCLQKALAQSTRIHFHEILYSSKWVQQLNVIILKYDLVVELKLIP